MITFIGEPLNGIYFGEETFSYPTGQAETYRKVLRESESRDLVESALCREYQAIISALKKMDIEFRILSSNPGPPDRSFIERCIKEYGCLTLPLGNFPPYITAYPKDLCTVIEKANLLLLNDRAVRTAVPMKNGWNSMVSRIGEGGYTLVRGSTMIVGSGLDDTPDTGIEVIKKAGINVVEFPSVVTSEYSRQQDFVTGIKCNGHIDRVACLLEGKDGKMNLIVDPSLVTADCCDPNPSRWFLRTPSQTRDLIRETFEPMGIKVHWPANLEIPCSPNLKQFRNGKVLMTRGEEALKELVTGIVGPKNLVETEIPIRFMPVWKRSGIGCKICEFPISAMYNY